MKIVNDRSGFTLLETLVTSALVILGMLFVATAMTSNAVAMKKQKSRLAAYTLLLSEVSSVSSTFAVQFPFIVNLNQTSNGEQIYAPFSFIKCFDLNGNPRLNELGKSDYHGMYIEAPSAPAPSSLQEGGTGHFCGSIVSQGGMEIHITPQLRNQKEVSFYSAVLLQYQGKTSESQQGITQSIKINVPLERYF